MAYEQRPNTIAAFINRKKEKETHADLTGDSYIECKCPECNHEFSVKHWVSIWKKKDKNGQTWLSMLVKPKIPRPPKPDPVPTENGEINIDDEIPF